MDKNRIIEHLKKMLINNPEPEPLGDDFNPMDWSGGNFDDAWSMGENRGYKEGAHSILIDILEFVRSIDEVP